jgi:hypothetical protein
VAFNVVALPQASQQVSADQESAGPAGNVSLSTARKRPGGFG